MLLRPKNVDLKRRQQAMADSSFDPTRPFAKFFTDIVTAEKAKVIKAIEAHQHKAPKTKVPFYYDDKTFSVSASHNFIKRLEKEN